MKKLKAFSKYFFITLLILIVASIIFLFTTNQGYKLRLVAAEVILSSQHRNLVKFTFLPQKELKEILENIHNPKYINNHDNDLSEKIVESIDTSESFKNSTEKLSALYDKMVENREIKKAEKENNYEYLAQIKAKQEKEKKSDGNLTVHITDIDQKFDDHFFKGKLMTISNPKNVKLASSKGQQISREYGEQIHVIAQRENAIGATNASGFLDQNGNGNGGTAIGIVIENGEITNTPGGSFAKDYVAGITSDGLLITGYYSSDELLALDVQYAAGFKPQLIANGEKLITSGNGGWGYGPRTAIGQKADGTILLIVVDGRQSHSIGASMKDIQDILYDNGAVNAMAMDGGSSAIMYYNGKNVTTPSSVKNIPRYIPNAWVVSPTSGQKVEIYENDKLVKSYTE